MQINLTAEEVKEAIADYIHGLTSGFMADKELDIVVTVDGSAVVGIGQEAVALTTAYSVGSVQYPVADLVQPLTMGNIAGDGETQKKRTRRTKEQMALDNAAEAKGFANHQAWLDAGSPENALDPVNEPKNEIVVEDGNNASIEDVEEVNETPLGDSSQEAEQTSNEESKPTEPETVDAPAVEASVAPGTASEQDGKATEEVPPPVTRKSLFAGLKKPGNN